FRKLIHVFKPDGAGLSVKRRALLASYVSKYKKLAKEIRRPGQEPRRFRIIRSYDVIPSVLRLLGVKDRQHGKPFPVKPIGNLEQLAQFSREVSDFCLTLRQQEFRRSGPRANAKFAAPFIKSFYPVHTGA